jgi:prepilin-type N-terminal cleavage/methylation domain-containing protein
MMAFLMKASSVMHSTWYVSIQACRHFGDDILLEYHCSFFCDENISYANKGNDLGRQGGFSLTEVMIAIGLIAALMLTGYNFYNHAIARAQANEAMTASKLIIDNVNEYYARFQSLPPTDNIALLPGPDGDTWNDISDTDGPFAGIYLPFKGVSNGSIAYVSWLHVNANEGQVIVKFKEYDIQAAVSGSFGQFRAVMCIIISSERRMLRILTMFVAGQAFKVAIIMVQICLLVFWMFVLRFCLSVWWVLLLMWLQPIVVLTAT